MAERNPATHRSGHDRGGSQGIQELAGIFQSTLAECERCVSYFQGEGEISWEGTRMDVDSVPYQIGIPERVAKRVLADGECDGCHASLDGMFEVWVRPTSEIELRARVDRVRRRYAPRLKEFEEFLAKHPSLGGTHTVGRELTRPWDAFRRLLSMATGTAALGSLKAYPPSLTSERQH